MRTSSGQTAPRKRFGQHFLHDARVIARIVAAISPAAGDTLVEIGPGRGALTLPLLAAAGELDVVEIDRDLAAALQNVAHDRPGLRIHVADALRFEFSNLAKPGGKIRVVGNLPYNISTPLLFHLLDDAAHVSDMVFMLQKEVAERIAAAPGSDAYGRLSVMVQYHCAVHWLFDVGRGAFSPPPKVDSSIIRLRPVRRSPDSRADDPASLKRVVTQAFSQRRKTLRNALRNELTEQDFARTGIDPARRAETLDVAEFVRLANAANPPATTGP